MSTPDWTIEHVAGTDPRDPDSPSYLYAPFVRIVEGDREVVRLSLHNGEAYSSDAESLARFNAANARTMRAARLIAAAPAFRDSLSEALSALAAAREMLGVFEDNGGHDGLRGEGYRATLDGIDRATAAGLKALEASK